ncbi:MAG: response regulator [Pseudomonadota bacterium]
MTQTIAPILIADDDQVNLDLVDAFLSQSGFETVTVLNGQEAVTQASEQPFLAILLDISMPILDGKQAATLIRGMSPHNRDTPIAALTAYQLDVNDPTLSAARIDAVFRKPVEWPALIDWLTSLTNQGAAPTDRPSHVADDAQAIDINEQMITQLRSSLPPETVQRLFSRFQEDLAQRLTELEQASAQQNPEEISKITHAICGIASAFGATSLEKQARAIHNDPKCVFAMNESEVLDRLNTQATLSEQKLQALIK